MLAIAYFFGIYSYSIFFLGLAGLLYRPVLITFTITFFLIGVAILIKSIRFSSNVLKSFFSPSFVTICFSVLILQMGINFVGTLGPEIGFDALWYHLAFPKLYLTYHSLIHVPGGLLYYSDMPKLTEMLYTGLLAFGSEIWPKVLHFVFGVLSCVVTYKIARKYLSKELSLFAVVIFYTNLVVGWESVSAYVDLTRTFFEVSAFWVFLEWYESKNKKLLIASAVLMGLAVATKLVALGSVVVYLGALRFIDKSYLSLVKRLKRVGVFAAVTLLIPLPWFIFSFIHTGNPFYPVFSSSFSTTSWLHLLNPFFVIQMVWNVFTHAPDPISPVYIAYTPLFIVFWDRLKKYSLLFYLALGFLVSWIVLPQSGEARFMIPYLPLFSILVVLLLSQLHSYKIKIPLFLFICITIFISLIYRGIANTKFIPVILGQESKNAFLAKHLNFSYGDFADVDGYFAKHIKPTDMVLLYGFHNLYYVNFPFIDSSWAQKGDTFNYVAVQGAGLPERFKYWNLVYFNNTTHVRLYSLKGYSWFY